LCAHMGENLGNAPRALTRLDCSEKIGAQLRRPGSRGIYVKAREELA
jgi:hypothetical protein